MTIWTPRGKDASGADTHITTNPHGTFLITDHPVGGVKLWRIVGLARLWHSEGYADPAAAKQAVQRMLEVSA